MKKMWLAIMLAATLVCWGGSAGAISIWGASNCPKCLNRTAFFEDCGDYHHVECRYASCAYVADLKHRVRCNSMTGCYDCGNKTHLNVAEIIHVEKQKTITNANGWVVDVNDYTFDEYKHYVECYCGGKVWEDWHYVSCYNDSKAEECGICHMKNPIISNEHKQHWFAGDDGSCWCGYNPNQRYPGDANNTSSVTLADVRVILSGNVSSESNADVNADGKVDQQDVLRIMQYLAGWDVTLQ